MATYSGVVADILGVGSDLRNFGVNNWALSRDQALTAISELSALEVAVLGGDVWERTDVVIQLTYDNWHCDPESGESAFLFTERSLDYAKKYIQEYHYRGRGEVLFALVLRA